MMYFYDSVEVLRETQQEVNGIRSIVFSVINTVKCRLTDDTTRALSLQSDQNNISTKFRKLYCHRDEDIVKGDLLRFDGDIYEIRSTPYKPRSFSSIHHQKFYLESIQEGTIALCEDLDINSLNFDGINDYVMNSVMTPYTQFERTQAFTFYANLDFNSFIFTRAIFSTRN
jgi:hypothetical protein